MKPQVEFVHAISYVNKIKTRFANDERVYKAFLEILNMYRKNLKTIGQVYDEVASLFKSHNDLLEEFTYFLPDFSTPAAGKKTATGKTLRGKSAFTSGQHSGALKRKGKGEKGVTPGAPPPENREEDRKTAASLAKELSFFERVKARLRNRESYNELIKCLNIFNSEVISKMELQSLVWDILGRHPDLYSGFSEFLARCESMDFEHLESGKGKDGKLSVKELQKLKIISAREKFLSRPISELDLSACERCGPSYRLLPKDYPKAPASARTSLCQEHLNDNWVSVTSGSEDYSFKAMRKNQYEEALFRCEDDRFELDMVLETTAVTICALQPIIDKLNAMPSDEANQFRIPEGTLSPIHLRTIERLYGIGTDRGSDIRRMILDYPSATAHVVMARLKQKDAEWKQIKTELTPVWVDVYEKNYNKSLDHRSFYFKQTDKKALSAKGMTGEIKEVWEKKKHSEDIISRSNNVTSAACNISPDLTFTYADRTVHDDIYAVLKFCTHEMMNSDHAERVMNTWRIFMEPFFGITRKDPEGDYHDDSAEQAALFVHGFDDDDDDVDDDVYDAGDIDDDDDDDIDGEDAENGDGDDDGKNRDKLLSAEGVVTHGSNEPTQPTFGDNDARNPDLLTSNESNFLKLKNAEWSDEQGEKSGDDSSSKHAYSSCNPLSGTTRITLNGLEHSFSTHETLGEGPIFYGHDGFYLLFRLHQHLYERLATARVSAFSMSQQFGQTANPAESRTARERSIHNDFLRLLFKLLNGTIESSNFEDECRILLGANSYLLFTLDKLIYKIVKQVQSLLADEMASKLLQLFDYERTRKDEFSEHIYHANANVLLLDEGCYRFSSFDRGKRLTLQLKDTSLDKADLPAGTMDAQFHGYLGRFLHASIQPDEILSKSWLDQSDRPPVYLRRTKLNPRPVDRKDEDSAILADKFADVVFNSLECKVSCSNSKISYVLDTEDIFYRKSVRWAGQAVHKRIQQRKVMESKFRQWLNTQIPSSVKILGTDPLSMLPQASTPSTEIINNNTETNKSATFPFLGIAVEVAEDHSKQVQHEVHSHDGGEGNKLETQVGAANVLFKDPGQTDKDHFEEPKFDSDQRTVPDTTELDLGLNK